MPDIDQAYIQTYESNVRHLAQQGSTLIRPKEMEVHDQSESHNWETMTQYPTNDQASAVGAATPFEGAFQFPADDDDRLGVQTKTSRLQDTPDVRPYFQKRRSLVATYDHGTSSEQEDIVQTLIDPNSNMALAQANAMKRKVDDLIVARMFDDMYIKGFEGTGTTVSFPTTQIVGDGSAPISFDITTEICEIFLKNDIDPDVRKCMFIGPTQMRKLLQLTEATSADYINAKALAGSGYISNWMGMDWVVSNRLNIPGVNEIDCFCLTDRALGLHVARDISTKVAEDPSKSFAWRIYSYMTMDCVRVEDQQIIKVHLADTL